MAAELKYRFEICPESVAGEKKHLTWENRLFIIPL
jgi:hypothetical protein